MAKDKESLSRQEKLDKIIEMGKNPYPSHATKKMTVVEAKDKEGAKVETAGKIFSIRSHGKSTFMDLGDDSGQIQIYFKQDVIGKDNYEFLDYLDSGDYIEVSGEVFKTKAGEITVNVSKYKLLSKTLLPMPDSWYGLKDVETRYRKRFLDLVINPEIREVMKTRSKIITKLREYMNDNGFLEFETPVLQPIPGGASAKPFITHYNILKQDMYLRIAPELYLKRLVVGGFEKVYEIGKNFRNEGLSHMHNPEFTMMEFYWAYKDYQDLMNFTEKMIPEVIKQIKGDTKVKFQGKTIDFKPPFERITFGDLVKRDCGIDIYKHKDFEGLKEEIDKKGIDIDYKEATVWSKLVDELYKKVSRPKVVDPIFLIDHPIELTPLAKAKEDEPDKAQRFQLVLAEGMELVNAYTELNDPIEQENRIKQQLEYREQGWEESEMLDKNYIQALKYGLPPTAGWGMGIERIAMILTDNYSIKEVIPFPTLKSKSE